MPRWEQCGSRRAPAGGRGRWTRPNRAGRRGSARATGTVEPGEVTASKCRGKNRVERGRFHRGRCPAAPPATRGQGPSAAGERQRVPGTAIWRGGGGGGAGREAEPGGGGGSGLGRLSAPGSARLGSPAPGSGPAWPPRRAAASSPPRRPPRCCCCCCRR